MSELGYVEGKNIIIEYRYTEGKFDLYPALAAELVRLKLDVIVSGGSANTRAVKEATTTIPIVMAQDGDPVGAGLVASLARLGGNYRTVLFFRGVEWQTTGASEGDRSRTLSCCCPRDFDQPRHNAQALKETELAAGARREDSIFRHARPERY
jgi:ABC transporter substrate binding protein